MASIIPIPSNLDLFLDISINIPGCNCQFHNCSAGWFEKGCSNGSESQTTILDRDFNEIENRQVPSNMRLVIDKTNKILKTRTTASSLLRFKNPKKENQRTVAAYYNGLKGQVEDGLICGELDATQAKKVLAVVLAFKKINLLELYALRQALRIGELNRTSQSLKVVNNCSKELCNIVIQVCACDFTKENAGKELRGRVKVLDTFEDADLERIKKRLNAIPDKIEGLTVDSTPTSLHQWDAKKLIRAAKIQAGVPDDVGP